DVYARRPQVQERLTTQIAESLMSILDRRRAGAPGEGRARLPGRSRRGGPLGGPGRWAGLFVQPCP
ncbi:GTP cyclohydrolase I, partial [Streptomyces globisporus]